MGMESFNNMPIPPEPDDISGREKIEKAEDFPTYHTKEEILAKLKEKGFEDPETQKAVLEWIAQREGEVKIEDTGKASVKFEFERIELYIAIGDMEGAYENAKYTYVSAVQEGMGDIVDKLLEMFPELEGQNVKESGFANPINPDFSDNTNN